MSSLYILDISKIFSPVVYVFFLDSDVFDAQVFNFDEVRLLILCVCVWCYN